MPDFSANCTSTVIPAVVYRDAPAAIEWLCQAFGFTKHAVYANPDGTIAHAQLTFGNGMVMLSSAAETEYQRQLMIQPSETEGRNTQTICLIVSDADAICALAKEAGADIVRDIRDEDYGGRSFSCRDKEGHLWSIGTYNPWA